MKTITIQIGNSDNKLTQQEWAAFIAEVFLILEAKPINIHFAGGSECSRPWQNYCWVIEVPEDSLPSLASKFRHLARIYKQDSIAFTTGITAML